PARSKPPRAHATRLLARSPTTTCRRTAARFPEDRNVSASFSPCKCGAQTSFKARRSQCLILVSDVSRRPFDDRAFRCVHCHSVRRPERDSLLPVDSAGSRSALAGALGHGAGMVLLRRRG